VTTTVRGFRFCPEVVKAIGQDQATRLQLGPWPPSFECTYCRIETAVDGGGPVAVSAVAYADGAIVNFSHLGCQPSLLIRREGARPDLPAVDAQARAGVSFHSGGFWPYLLVEVKMSCLLVPTDEHGNLLDGKDVVTLELSAYTERGLVPASRIGPYLPPLPDSFAASPLVMLNGGSTGGGAVYLPKAEGDRRRAVLMEPMPPLMPEWVEAVAMCGQECAVYVASQVGLFALSDDRYPQAMLDAFRAGRIVGGRARVVAGARA
jgi:hypothetical protein